MPRPTTLRLGLELAEKAGADLMQATDPDAHRVGIAGAAIDADERLAAVADALDHDLHEEGHIGDDGIRSQRRLAAIVGQRDVVDDRCHLGKQRQTERRRAEFEDVRANGDVG